MAIQTDGGVCYAGVPCGKNVTARRNPQGRASRKEEVEQAAKLLKDFSGHEPTKIMRVTDKSSSAGLVIGDLDGVFYSATRDGKLERYVHEFRKKSRPLLAASHDGKSLRILGGEFEFTEAGIEDR